MKHTGHPEPVSRFINFQERLHESFPKRADALTEVIDARQNMLVKKEMHQVIISLSLSLTQMAFYR